MTKKPEYKREIQNIRGNDGINRNICYGSYIYGIFRDESTGHELLCRTPLLDVNRSDVPNWKVLKDLDA